MSRLLRSLDCLLDCLLVRGIHTYVNGVDLLFVDSCVHTSMMIPLV